MDAGWMLVKHVGKTCAQLLPLTRIILNDLRFRRLAFLRQTKLIPYWILCDICIGCTLTDDNYGYSLDRERLHFIFRAPNEA